VGGRELASLNAHAGLAIRSAFRPDGTLIASVGWDGAVVLWGVPGVDETSAPAEVLVETSDVLYADGSDRQRLDVYLPDDTGESFPTLLALPGRRADKAQLATLARYFVERGYAVVAVNYREAVYPLAVQDAFCALAWTHASAEVYGFDPRRIVALGHSRGGMLAAMLGTVDDPGLYAEGCPHPLPAAERLQGVVALAGLFDFAARAESISANALSDLVAHLGGEPDQVPETWAEASPITWVDGSEPPFLLVHGETDREVGSIESTRFAAALEEAGGKVELVLMSDLAHVMVPTSMRVFQAVEAFLATLAE